LCPTTLEGIFILRSKLKYPKVGSPEYQFFVEEFVDTKSPWDFSVTNKSGKWRTETRYPLTDRYIDWHLKGETSIALRGKKETDVLIVDIDNHQGNKKDLYKRFDETIKEFPNPTFIMESPTGGFHVYYDLVFPLSTEDLNSAVKSKLKIQSGEREPFPALNRGIRLPFGKGMYLLDVDTLKRCKGNKIDQINALCWYRIENEKTSLSISEIGLQEIPLSNPWGQIGENGKLSKSNFVKRVQFFKENGLQKNNTRYDRTLEIIWYLIIREGYSPERTESTVIQWIQSKHNGKSKQWIEDRNTVLAEIHSLVKSCYQWKCKNNNKVFKKKIESLGVGDIKKILSLTDNYKTQTFIFNVLILAKSTGIIKGETVEFFMSVSLMKTFKNCSKEYKECLIFCKEKGLLNFDWDNHRVGYARDFTLNWTLCDSQKSFNSLQDYLRSRSIKDMAKYELFYNIKGKLRKKSSTI